MVFSSALQVLYLHVGVLLFVDYANLLTTTASKNTNAVNAYCFNSAHIVKSTRPTRNGFKFSTAFHVSTTTEQQTIDDGKWKGEVVPGGTIRGCEMQQVEGTLTEWIITIDGIEADLGRFSDAIYKKITSDAKRQTFQGFRPGTIPPHLDPTYRAFTMDECARETVLEAMTQNNIRPFESSRSEFQFVKFSIPPPTTNKSKKKSPGKNKSKQQQSSKVPSDSVTTKSSSSPAWLEFETMKEAIDAGWRPGQSFSFVARSCKGQKLRDQSEVIGAKPLGLNY
jgi:hypothetical protein